MQSLKRQAIIPMPNLEERREVLRRLERRRQIELRRSSQFISGFTLGWLLGIVFVGLASWLGGAL